MTPDALKTFERLQIRPEWYGDCAYCVHHAEDGSNEPCFSCAVIDDLVLDDKTNTIVSKLPHKWTWHHGHDDREVG